MWVTVIHVKIGLDKNEVSYVTFTTRVWINSKPEGMAGCTGDFPTTAVASWVVYLSYKKSRALMVKLMSSKEYICCQIATSERRQGFHLCRVFW